MDKNGNVKKSKNLELDEPEGDSYFGGALKFKTKVYWPNAIGFFILHLAGFYGFYLSYHEIKQFRFLSPVVGYFISWLGGEGVTAGAHRLWSHKSYKARLPLKILLVVCQTFAGQNCCYIWVRDHRLHHKYSDTDADPHNINRGLFFSHMGWLMMKKHPEVIRKGKGIDMSDLESDPVVMFQKRHFKKMYFVLGFLVSLAIPYYCWGETLWNALFICYFGRYVLLLNITWTVNSLAHYYGMKPYDRNIYSRQNWLVSFLCYGEGWHNYHHVFPWDYKASEFGQNLNFTRGLIEFFEKIGWAYDLKEASKDMVKSKIKRSGDGTHDSSKEMIISHEPATSEQQLIGW